MILGDITFFPLLVHSRVLLFAKSEVLQLSLNGCKIVDRITIAVRAS